MQASEDFRPLYWIMLGLGVVAVLILGLGVATLLRFAPPGEHSGYHARVIGVYPYDSLTRQVDGPPSAHFRRDQPFAAQVEWDRLPAGMIVGARWYDSLESQVGSVGPEPAGRLASRGALVAVITPPPLHANLPGSYTLKVIRYSGGQPVEVIDTESVVVLHDP
jgi:hypothetical protein